MSSQEVVVCAKIQDQRCCFKASIELENKIEDLTREERSIAEDARRGALRILQDALKKKDKVLMQVPKKLVLDEEDHCQFWMKRHAIVTEDLVNNLIAELMTVKFKKGVGNFDRSLGDINTSERMKKATFKKDSSDKAKRYAYVFPKDMTKTIYLCEMFWKAHEYLEKDSRPGTLIHEVSHFLGTRDLTYEESTILAGCKGHRIKASPENSSSSSSKTKENIGNFLESIGLPCINRLTIQGKPDNYVETSCYNALGEPVWNANNIEYEFELTIKHKGNYENGKYSCCRERERYSVCDCSVPDDFHTCDSEKKIYWVDEITLLGSITLETTYFTLNSRTQPRKARVIELLLKPHQAQLIRPSIKMLSQSRYHNKLPSSTSLLVFLKYRICDNLSLSWMHELSSAAVHKKYYVGGKYSCCGETARYSVCDWSVPAFFHTCRVGKRWKMEPLVKKLCCSSKKIKGKLKEYQRIAEEMEEYLRKAKTSDNFTLSMIIVGAAAGAGALLAPATFGLSLLVGVGVGAAASGAGRISMITFKKRAAAQKKKLDAIFAKCQSFFDNVKTVLTWLKDETLLSTDRVFHCYSFLKCIINWINLIIEQLESKENYLPKIMSMESDIEQCAVFLEQVCKLLFE